MQSRNSLALPKRATGGAGFIVMSATVIPFPQQRARRVQHDDDLRQLAELVAARTRRKGIACTAESLLPRLREMLQR